MRILIVNTSENTGGAAVAANRLMVALNNNGEKAKMLVRDKQTENISVIAMPQGWRQQWNFLWERWCIFWRMHFSRKHLFEVDIANAGWDITKTPEFQEADVIHLHWVNQGMLSLKGIGKIPPEAESPWFQRCTIYGQATAICHSFTLLTVFKGIIRSLSHCQLPGRWFEKHLHGARI